MVDTGPVLLRPAYCPLRRRRRRCCPGRVLQMPDEFEEVVVRVLDVDGGDGAALRAHGRAVAADDRAWDTVGSGGGGDQQGERGDDDGDADVVEAVPAVHLLLPVGGPVVRGPRLAPVVARYEKKKGTD